MLAFVDLIVVIANHSDRDVFPVDYYTPAIKIATLVSVIKKCYDLRINEISTIFVINRPYQLHYCILIDGSVYERLDYNSYSGYCW